MTRPGGEQRAGYGRVPRGEGIERAVAAVCRHLDRDGTSVVNLVTEESMIGGEKSTAKPGSGFSLTLTKHVDYALAQS